MTRALVALWSILDVTPIYGIIVFLCGVFHGRKFKWHIFASTKDLFKPTTSPNHHLPHGHHVANDSPPQQKKTNYDQKSNN